MLAKFHKNVEVEFRDIVEFLDEGYLEFLHEGYLILSLFSWKYPPSCKESLASSSDTFLSFEIKQAYLSTKILGRATFK